MSESSVQPVTQPTTEQHLQYLAGESLDDLYCVVLHNDDVTPFDYVIYTLGSVFMLSEEIADHIAWTAHTKGAAVVVMRPRNEAEKLVKVACTRAKLDGFPLTFTLEQE
jgi:ATP-dependent Clp protease adaptor protein ClpS